MRQSAFCLVGKFNGFYFNRLRVILPFDKKDKYRWRLRSQLNFDAA
tara:strand:+ start:171 stop:308 length:138 start_codon:yes stop_codon:yes gene_type:complete